MDMYNFAKLWGGGAMCPKIFFFAGGVGSFQSVLRVIIYYRYIMISECKAPDSLQIFRSAMKAIGTDLITGQFDYYLLLVAYGEKYKSINNY